MPCAQRFAAGEDYIAVNKTLLLGFEFTSQCVHIPILTDECLEQTESFDVSLSSRDDCFNFTVSEVTVYILEDDGMCMELPS